ncbi:MAG: glycosyltransferase family 9 protein [Bdellovibrionales bacterium]
MKILVLSLLRLGDAVLATPAIHGLKKRYPNAELHLALNKQFQGLAPLLPYVDRFHFFDRNKIQESLALADRPLFESYDRLSDFLLPLQAENFDLVVNLTQNKLSGWLTSMISSKDKMGLHFRQDGVAQFGSPWFRHLNQWGLEITGPQFHFADIFYNGAVGPQENYQFEVSETTKGQDEAKALCTSKKYITVQLLTNDKKKNWHVDRFHQAIETFRKMNLDFEVLVLCSPAERKDVQLFVERFQDKMVRTAECSLEGLFSLLKRSSLLLTGDTATKHLACAALTPIVELSIGSSHYFQTGSYLNDSLIIQSTEPCAPCHHSKDCPQKSHLCSERVPGDLVGLLCSKLLVKDWSGIKVISDEFTGYADVLRVAKVSSGHWTAVPLAASPSAEYVDKIFDQMSWMLLLNNEHNKSLTQIGSLGRRLGEFFERYFSSYDKDDIALRLFEFENNLESLEAKIDIFLIDFQEVLKSYSQGYALENFCQSLNDYSFTLSQKVFLNTYSNALAYAQKSIQKDDAFVLLRRIRESLFDVKHRCQLETKLVRSVKKYMENHL